jgi:hypothetical protein
MSATGRDTDQFEISLTPGPRPARVTLRRLGELPDIDSSGRYHNSAVIRWIEAAEEVLHTRLDADHSQPWPEAVRTALSEGGDRSAQ